MASPVSQRTIFTLGSSLHSWPLFVRLLHTGRIELVIDVRSSPRSRLPHFNRSMLTGRLAAAGVRYVFLGGQLGGRPENGEADYDAMSRDPGFVSGVDEVMRMAAVFKAALMCSEHEPLLCHRYLLVGRALAARGVAVRHLLRDGAIEEQQDTDERLLSLHRRDTADLVTTREARLDQAYRLQNQRLWTARSRSK